MLRRMAATTAVPLLLLPATGDAWCQATMMNTPSLFRGAPLILSGLAGRLYAGAPATPVSTPSLLDVRGTCCLRERLGTAIHGGHRRQGSAGCLLRAVAGEDNGGDSPRLSAQQANGRAVPCAAFTAAANFRGGGGIEGVPTDASKVKADILGGGADGKKTKAELLNKVGDKSGGFTANLVAVGLPAFHTLRLGFGLALLFYGMAFKTFAFHVIIFRITGWRQVSKSVSNLFTKYRTARDGIKEAAEAAEEIGERLVHEDALRAARQKMIAEKEELMADGNLSPEQTAYFMDKFNPELEKIIEEQQQFNSARSSIFSVTNAVDPKGARESVVGVYNALIATFTASNLKTAGQIALGLHIGSLLKTHVLDFFGPILDPVGYRLDLDTYYNSNEIPYMGKANAMGGPRNLYLNIICYSSVLAIFRMDPSMALKTSMIYYGARVVTDYVIIATDPIRRRFGQTGIVHTPYSACIHACLTALGFYFHRDTLLGPGGAVPNPLTFGPGLVGLIEPFVRLAVKFSNFLHRVDFFSVRFIENPVGAVKSSLKS